MKKYTVQELSSLAGVTVRTLHHYDEIGLLQPYERSEKGYRYYTREQLLQLQQIMLYRELDIPLKAIAVIMQSADYDVAKALEHHREELVNKRERMDTLLDTIDKTIASLKNKKMKMTDEELYDGFSKEVADAMREEVKKRWGEKELLETEERIKLMDREQWKDVKEEGHAVTQLLADVMYLPADHILVQKAIQKHFQHIGRFYEVSEERYRGLGKLYVEDEKFKAYYEKYKEGLADFVQKAINVFCDNGMKLEEYI